MMINKNDRNEFVAKNVFPAPSYLLVKLMESVYHNDFYVGEIIKAHSTELQQRVPLALINKTLVIFSDAFIVFDKYTGEGIQVGDYMFVHYNNIIGFQMKDDNEENVSGKKTSNQ